MISAILGAFGGGAGISAVLTIFIKLMDRGAEAKERNLILAGRRTKLDIEAMNATAHRTNGFWGNFSRFILLIIPQAIMVALLFIGYYSPETVIWIGQDNQPSTFSVLFGLFEVTTPKDITWRAFNGIVILPILFAQAGAVTSYFLVSGTFSRR